MRMPLLPLLLLACEYDPETWRSPLASGFSGTPSVEEGERIFYEEHWEDDTPYACQAPPVWDRRRATN